MPADDTALLLAELLDVLRRRVAPEALTDAARLVDYLNREYRAQDALEFAADRVRAAVFLVDGVVGDAARAMTGLDDSFPETMDPSTSREDIKLLVGRLLDQRRGQLGYTARRVEQLEAELICPLVARHLGIVDFITVPRRWSQRAEDDGNQRILSGDRRHRPVFVQYCNPEFLRLSGLGPLLHIPEAMKDLLQRATRLALLLTDDLVIFPASYLFEVPGFRHFLEEAGPARDAGLFAFISPTADLDVFQEQKAEEYREDGANPYAVDGTVAFPTGLVWRPRGGEPTAVSIAHEWDLTTATAAGLLERVARSIARRTGQREQAVLDRLATVPGRLEGRAFVGRFAREVAEMNFSASDTALIDIFLSSAYLHSYVGDMDATILIDFPFGDLALDVRPATASDPRVVSVRPLLTALSRIGLDEYMLDHATWDEFLTIRNMPEIAFVMDSLAERRPSRAVGAALAKTRHPSGRSRSLAMAQSSIKRLSDMLQAGSVRDRI